MLTQDIQKLNQTLKQTRRSRKFQSQFATLLHTTPNKTHTHKLLLSFPTKFPHLTQLKQALPFNHSYWSMNQNTQNGTIGTKSLREEDEEELNREDQEFWKRHYREIKSMPVLESREEIGRLVSVFKELEEDEQNPYGIQSSNKALTKQDSQKKPNKKTLRNLKPQTIYDAIFEIYQDRGGDKNYEQLKQKIQSDVLTLVFRQIHKKKQTTSHK